MFTLNNFCNKKADTGIGTLIVFIAMILVAAIAAGVLIQTATSLQNKALLTGMRSKNEVSTALAPILVYGEDGSNHYIDFLYLKLKLIPGSEPIKLENALLSFNLNNQSAELNFREINESNGEIHNCTYTGNEADSGFMTVGDSGNYSVKYLLKGTQYKEGYIKRGDVIILCFQSPRPVYSDEDIKIEFSPKVGKSMVVETAVPEAALTKRVYLFP